MIYPLLPYSQLVYDLMREIPGVYDIPILLKAEASMVDIDRLDKAARSAIRNHPVFMMKLDQDGHSESSGGDEFNGRYHRIRIYKEGRYVYISVILNRILGDSLSLYVLAQDFIRAYNGESLEPDDYTGYLEKVENHKKSEKYASHKSDLEKEFTGLDCPVRPHTDFPLNDDVIPIAGIYTDSYDDGFIASLENLAGEEHITLTGFFVLCAALAIMEYEGTDAAALSWAYGGRDHQDEQRIFGSLHKDIPIRIERCDDGKKLLKQVRDGIRRGISHSDYPYTLTHPHTEIWNYALNVLQQPDLDSILNDFPFPVEAVQGLEKGPDIAYSLLDMEIHAGSGIRLVYRYSASHYKEESIKRFASIVRRKAEMILGIRKDSPVSHHPVTAKLADILDKDKDLHDMMVLSLEKAAESCPDRKMNPVRSLDDLYHFLDRFLTGMPWESLGLGEDIPLFSRIDQSTGYFLFLTDQPLTQLEGRGYLYPSVQYIPGIAEWIIEFNNAWREFLDSSDSWNDGCYAAVESDPLFGLREGWYEDSGNWHTWNEFFSRRLSSPEARPVGKSLIVAPCDGMLHTMLNISMDNRLEIPNSLPLKTSSLRSVSALLGDSPFRDSFAGGSFIHQVLDFYDYHRFHSPVDGVIVDIRRIDGISGSGGVVVWNGEKRRYEYSNPDEPGFQMIETRGIIVIENKEIGLVAVVPVGMAQVCSVNWSDTALLGASVSKGEELGYFLCGGSDVIILLQKDALLHLKAKPGSHLLMGSNLLDKSAYDKQGLIMKLSATFDVDFGEISPESDIVKTLQLDSLSIFELVVIVKETTGVSIPACDFPKIMTFGNLFDYIDKRLLQDEIRTRYRR